MSIRDCALNVGNFLDSDYLVASYICMYMNRHTLGTLDLHQRYKQVSCCAAQYIHGLFESQVSLAARWLISQ